MNVYRIEMSGRWCTALLIVSAKSLKTAKRLAQEWIDENCGTDFDELNEAHQIKELTASVGPKVLETQVDYL